MNCDDNDDNGKSILLVFSLLVILFPLKAWKRFLSDNSSVSLYNCVIKPKLSNLMLSLFPNIRPWYFSDKVGIQFLIEKSRASARNDVAGMKAPLLLSCFGTRQRCNFSFVKFFSFLDQSW